MTRTLIGLLCGILAVVLLPAAALPAQQAQQTPSGCPEGLDALEVPGAEHTQAVCLEDLTTFSSERRGTAAGTRDNQVLQSAYTEYPEQAVPGIQIEGWFPDSCDHYEPEPTSFMPRCANGLRHNSQFVIRIPFDWNGEHLVITGAPGVRDQWASDLVVGDWMLYRGWAYASHDKGNIGLNFFRAGDTETDGGPPGSPWVPPRAMEQWAPMMERTALAAQGALEELFDRAPTYTYASGISNGGYQTRLAVERYPEIFDGGIDWEGTLIQPDVPNIFTDIPVALQNYLAARAGSQDAFNAMVHQGHLPPDSSRVWDQHNLIYWGPVASAYRPVIDPEYTSYIASPRTPVLPADPDAQYDYASRPDFVRERMALIGNTGDLHGKPFITLHPTLDALLPIKTHSDLYADMVRAQGHAETFRYYVVEGGTHVDTLADDHTDVMRPVLPCYLDAVDALDRWVRTGEAPPPSGFVPFPADADAEERANSCALPGLVDRAAGSNRVETAIAASRGAFVLAPAAVIADAGNFPDALAAAPLAAHLEGPVLLVHDEVTDTVIAELERLGVMEVVIVGGAAAVSEDVAGALDDGPWEVRRVAGADRFATAAAIAAELPPSQEAIIANGWRFPDALSAGPLAARAGTPILLVDDGDVPPATAEALERRGVDRTVVVGGEEVVPGAVMTRLPPGIRLAGPNRYATSAAVAAYAIERGHSLMQVGIATGRTFPDALTAGPVTFTGYGGADGGGVVLLVDDVPAAQVTLDLLTAHRAEVEGALVFGGTAAVDQEAVRRVEAALR
jgi:hypothetical protein